MTNIIIVFVILLLLLWRQLVFNNRILLSPSVAFITSFVFATGYALFSLEYIQLNLATSTAAIVVTGILVFVLVCDIMNVTIKKRQIGIQNRGFAYPSQVRKLKVLPVLVILHIIVSIYVIYSYRSFYIRVTGQSTFAQAVYLYRDATMFGDQEQQLISGYILTLRRACISCGYVFSYVFIHGFIYKYKNNKALLAICIVLSGACNIMSGSRGPLITYVLTIMMQFYLILGNSKNWINVINTKIVFRTLFILLFILGSFEIFGGILGRGTAKTLGDYIAVYLSAPLKNLDKYVRNGDFGTDFANNQTLVYLFSGIGRILGLDSWVHGTDQPFQYNSYGRGLGNVYTTFYSFLYDGGVFTLVIYVIVMAALCQWIFYRATKPRSNSKFYVNIPILVYSYLFPHLCMSFFSNKFYENIFNPIFIRYLIVWLILSRYLFRIKLKIKRQA